MIKKGDFIEIDYVGKIIESNHIFDLTSEKKAKEEKVFNPKAKYGSKIICVGENALVKGIDNFIIGKEIKKYTVDLTPENAFGKKDPKLMKIMPMSIFIKQNLKPFPGLQIHVDGLLGIVKTVSGGRVIVDFNHPIAGRNVTYEIEIKRLVQDDKEKIQGFLESIFGKADFDYKENKLSIHNLNLPKEILDKFGNKIKELIPSVKEVKFETEKKEYSIKQETAQNKPETTNKAKEAKK